MAAVPGDDFKKMNSDFYFLTTHCADQNKKSVISILKGCLFNNFGNFHGYASLWKQISIKVLPDTDTVYISLALKSRGISKQRFSIKISLSKF